MCGIFAYLNYQTPQSRDFILKALVKGLRRLEYRGYDSAGLAVDTPDRSKPEIFRMKGAVDELEKLINSSATQKELIVDNHIAISHTRWATHGEPAERNSHPQRSDKDNQFVVVHNGIITNYATLKQWLIGKGFSFESDTDTEVIAKLALQRFSENKIQSFRKLMSDVAALIHGAFAIIIKSSHYPGECIAMKRGSPLILGIKYPLAQQAPNGNVGPTAPSGSSAPSTLPLDYYHNVPRGSDTRLPIKVLPVSRNASIHSFKDPSVATVEFFLASDATAIVEHTKNVVFLEDNDMVHFQDGTFALYSTSEQDKETERIIRTLEYELDQIDKGEFKHFMQKEIYEQTRTLREVMRGRVDFEKNKVKLGGINSHLAHIKRSNRVVFIACGTSYHSCLATRGLVEELADLPVMLELASDFLDRCPPIYRNDTCVFISQSGETADTLRALEYCKKQDAICVGITNTVGSAIARHTDCGIYLNCGPEIGVASTKAYTSQVAAIILFALQLGDDRMSSHERRKEIIQSLKDLPDKAKQTLERVDKQVRAVAEELKDSKSILILGRGYQYATCLESALKIKEISYIHCEGVMAGELKHGPLALIDASMPTIFIATKDKLYEKTKSGFEQVIARKGKPIVVCSEDDQSIPDNFEKIRVPTTIDCLQAVINIIPMQLLSYHLAVVKGKDVDKPRNLAKSVTVE